MMLVEWLTVVLVAGSAAAEVPSYISVCGRRSPDLGKCMLATTNSLRDRLKAGIPEIDMPAQEPLHIAGFTLSDTDSLKAFAHDVTVRGLGDYTAESMNGDLKARQFHAVMRFKKITMDGEYDFDSKIIFPISGHGPIHIAADDVLIQSEIKYDLVKINGVDHIRYASVATSLSLKNWTAVFEPSESMDQTLVTALNTALEGSRNEIFETLRPNIEKVISQVTMDIGNKVNEHFTYEELFPDRE